MSNSSGTMVYVPNFSNSVPAFGHSQRVPTLKMQRLSGKGGLTTVSRSRTRRKRALVKSFKSKVKSINPAKHLSNSTGVTINNTEIYTLNFTSQIIQGTTNAQRLGDSVYLEALKLEGFFQSATDPNCYRFRLMIGYSGEEYGPAVLQNGNLTASELFLPNTVTTPTLGVVNPKAFTLLYDEVHDLNSQVTDYRTIGSFRATIPLKQQFPYQAPGSAFGKTKNLYCVVVAYAADVAVSVPIGSAVMSYDLIFKD